MCYFVIYFVCNQNHCDLLLGFIMLERIQHMFFVMLSLNTYICLGNISSEENVHIFEHLIKQCMQLRPAMSKAQIYKFHLNASLTPLYS